MDVLEVVVFAIAIFLFVYLIVVQPHKIKGSSMEPNFPDGEYLLTDKLSYRFKEPKRGEVIVFDAPGTEDEEFIKRIIGLPGETVAVDDNKVYINSQLLVESYLEDTILTRAGAFLRDGESVVVPNDHYIVLGDNRPFSSDSRSWGLIEKADITGRAWIVYWPPPSVGLIKEVNYNLN